MSTKVVVTDIDMPFKKMVVFILKWMLASIPAVIIVWIIMMIFALIFGGLIGGIATAAQ